jgi:hypothetical protein
VLEPDDRHPLLDALQPPAGFELDRAVGTTFSLDLQALLTAPVAFALFEAKETDAAQSATVLLEAIRRFASRIDVFCQAGQIPIPRDYRPLLAYVEDVVHDVTPATKGRVFHPKVWIIRFRSREGEVSYRLLCLSRNLTFDRSWDTVLRLDGSPARRSRKLTARNRPLAKFVDALPALAVRDLDEARADAVRELAEELLAVEFELPTGFYELRFWPLGIRGLPNWPFPHEGWAHSRLLVVSPFLSPGLLSRLHAEGARDALLSRAETLDTLSPQDLEDFEEVFVLSQPATGEDEPAVEQLSAEDEDLAERPDFPLAGLHAKLFVSEYSNMARLWTGSANATNAAFGGNVEFLVELQGARSACGLDAVLHGQSGRVKLIDLLESYQPSGAPPPETEQQLLEQRLEDVRREIASRGFEASVLGLKTEDESYELVIRSQGSEPPPVLRGVQARMWPIALGEGAAKPLGTVFSKGIRFSPVSFGGLTAFFAVGLVGKSRDAEAAVRFVVTASLVGAPTNRHDRLLTSILRNQSDVLRYLVLLLAGEDEASLAGSFLGRNGQPGDSWAAWSGLPLLESMVRALAREPERLDHIARLLESLGASEEGRARIPDGLTAVWEPIWEARRGQHS